MNIPMLRLPAISLRRTTSAMTLLTMLPHLFCCGIPAVAALISLGTTVGLAASLAGNPFYQFVDVWHTELITLAVCSVVLSGLINLLAWRMDCRAAAKASLVEGHCTHGDCTPKKTTSFRLFFLSLGLLVVDLAWFMTEEHVLGLHHHEHETVATDAAATHHH
jgi:hypothetical protein